MSIGNLFVLNQAALWRSPSGEKYQKDAVGMVSLRVLRAVVSAHANVLRV